MKISRKIVVLTFFFMEIITHVMIFQPAFAQTATDSASSADTTLPTASSSAIIPPLTPSIPPINISTQSYNSASKRTSPVVQKLAKQFYRSDEDVSVAITNPQDDTFQVAVLNSKGQKVNDAVQETDNSDAVTFSIAPQIQFTPGKYTVKITDNQGKTSEQNFQWGVLAINTDRSIYTPGQTADIAIAVLDEQGNMVCDANVDLQITNTGGNVHDDLSTDNGRIAVNQQCQSHDFSLKPDYETHYQIPNAGSYSLTLTAQTKNGKYSITDQLLVKDQVPFDVQRISATRIYPLNSYPVQLNITANQDFTGKVTETVPDSFTITASNTATSYDNMQTVYIQRTSNPANHLQQQILGASTTALGLPFTGNYPITEGFGAPQTDPSLRKVYQAFGLAGHDGVDFGLPFGTPVLAADDGTVQFAGPGDYGITIIIQHSWGKSYYGHLSKVLVSVNQQVHRGQQIGISGDTGESTGPHLHFGMKPNKPDMSNGYFGKIDPLPYLSLPEPQLIAETNDITATSSAVLGASTSAILQDNTASFTKEVRNQLLDIPTTTNFDKVKVLTWNVSIRQGQTMSLGYTFKAPEVSPQFYLLGPLRFYDGTTNATIFQEQRQWQLAADAVGTRWYNYNWQYRKQLTIDHTKVSGGSDLSNFPVLINLTSDSDLSAQAQSTGNDILFTSSDGQTKLNHEIEKYTSASGALVAWVNVPTVSASSDTIIYMYFGNAAAGNQQNASSVWTSNYDGVWHLSESPTGTAPQETDSTTNGNNLTTHNMVSGDLVNGQIDGSINFNGGNPGGYLDTPDASSLKPSGDMTISMWIKLSQTASSAGRVFMLARKVHSVSPFESYQMYISNSTNILNMNWANSSGTEYSASGTTALTSTSTWYYVTFVHTGTTMKIYLNGVDDTASSATTTGTILNSDGAFDIGETAGGTAKMFYGIADEIRLSGSARSAGWIATNYANENSPSTFYTLGSSIETDAYAPTLDELMRGGKWFCSPSSTPACTSVSAGVQPYTF